MDRIAENFFDLEVMARYLPSIIDGVFVTIHLAILIVLSGLALGFVLAVVRAFQIRPVNWLIVLVVDVFRALPPIVIMIVFYFALPFVGISMSGFVVAWLSLTLVLASFAEEIFWTGILSVDRGQWEAARSTGLGFLPTLRDVVLPQAVRLTIPPLTNRTIVITKSTAIASVVAVQEILTQASAAQAFSANTTPLTMAAGPPTSSSSCPSSSSADGWNRASGGSADARPGTRRMEALVHNFFNLEILLKVHPLLLKGFWMTIQLCLLVVPLGVAGGLVVGGRLQLPRALAQLAAHRLRRLLPLVPRRSCCSSSCSTACPSSVSRCRASSRC